MKAYPVKVYRTLLGQWRWKVKADNGKTIGASSESFWNRKDCEDNADKLGFSLSNRGK